MATKLMSLVGPVRHHNESKDPAPRCSSEGCDRDFEEDEPHAFAFLQRGSLVLRFPVEGVRMENNTTYPGSLFHGAFRSSR
ncbi:hypothetical protein BHM03_00044463 [Ensete ventricosum]|nr:hypothetical protein BHM03_00044463 [Ensete ventricosum]